MKYLIVALMGVHSLAAHAMTAPLFSMVPQGALPTTITASGTATVKYTVTNNTPYTLQNIGLNYKPAGQTPIGVTQTTSGTNSPSTCANAITLKAGGSCTLVLTVTGSELEDGGAFGGPELCYTGSTPSRCSVPEPGAQLNIALTGSMSTLSLAVGKGGAGPFPYIAQSIDSGVTWTSWTAPSGLTSQGNFVTASCGTTICIAGGVDLSTNEPLLVQTIDNGTTWSIGALPNFMIQTLKTSNAGSKRILGTACTSSECVAVGFDGSLDPVIYQTLNSGSTWNKISSLGGAVSDWNATACSTALCIVVGDGTPPPLFASRGLAAAPLIAQSPEGTANWTYADLSGITIINGFLFSAACIADYCVAGGYDADIDGPVLISTLNAGLAWSQYDLTNVSGYPLSSQIELNGAACASSICVTVGDDISDRVAPPLFVTTDDGLSWSYVDISGTTPPTPNGGILYQVSCSTDICVSVGQDADNLALLVQSTNGTDWTRIDLTLSPFLITDGALHGINCDGIYCVAGGEDNSAGPSVPFLIQTVDGGANWVLVTPAGAPSNGTYSGTVATAFKKLWNNVKHVF